MDTKNITYGRFVTDVVRGPANVTDCSGWETLGEEITYGSFVTDVVRGPVVAQRNEKLRQVYSMVNDLSIAKFGKALSIQDFQQYLLTDVPAEVLS
jgi:hypothetical protein